MIEATVLIVDDEEAILTLLRYNLEKEGFKVMVAGFGVGYSWGAGILEF